MATQGDPMLAVGPGDSTFHPEEPGSGGGAITLSPTGAVIGDPDVVLHVTGTGFTGESRIVFNGGIEPTEFVSDTEVTTVVKPSTAGVAITVPVYVDSPDGPSTDVADFTFSEPVIPEA